MWDYDKLFAEGNIVGIKNKLTNILNPTTVYDKSLWGNIGYVDWRNYFNSNLSFISNYSFEIQYIIRLDEHGNVVEKLFDRERDMPKPMPELETGMFGKILRYRLINNNPVFDLEEYFGEFVIVKDKVVYRNGGFDFLNSILKNDKYCKEGPKIVEIYGDATSFNSSIIYTWRSPEYQAYLDSKN